MIYSVRGIRGAITVDTDDVTVVLAATRRLLEAMLAANPDLRPEDLASAWFSVTPDLTSVYPARAAREMGWSQVPLMCVQEMAVTGSLPRCIRALLHWNTGRLQSEITHVYLEKAAQLRPDLLIPKERAQ